MNYPESFANFSNEAGHSSEGIGHVSPKSLLGLDVLSKDELVDSLRCFEVEVFELNLFSAVKGNYAEVSMWQ